MERSEWFARRRATIAYYSRFGFGDCLTLDCVFALKSDASDFKHRAKVLLFPDIAKEYYARYEN